MFCSDMAVANMEAAIACRLGEGWSLGTGDLLFRSDSEDKRWHNLPIGFAIGKIAKMFT